MSRYKNLKRIFLIALIIRLILVVIQMYVFPLPDSQVDAVNFEEKGWQLAQYWKGEEEVYPNVSGGYSYSIIIALIYYIFGRIVIFPHILNALLGLFIVFMAYKLTKKITLNENAPILAAFMATFFPSFNLYSAILLRENFIVSLLSISIYLFVKWYQTQRLGYFIISAIFIFLSSLLHNALILILFIYALYFISVIARKKQWQLKSVLIISFSSLISLAFFLKYIIFDKIPQNLNSLFTVSYFVEHLKIYSTGRSAYLRNYYPEDFLDIIYQTPIRIFYFLFSPFFLNVSNWKDFFGAIDSFIYIFLMVSSIVGFYNLWKKDKILVLFFASIILFYLIMFSWGTSNYGAAIRHREKIAILLIVLSSYGISEKFRNRVGKFLN